MLESSWFSTTIDISSELNWRLFWPILSWYDLAVTLSWPCHDLGVTPQWSPTPTHVTMYTWVGIHQTYLKCWPLVQTWPPGRWKGYTWSAVMAHTSCRASSQIVKQQMRVCCIVVQSVQCFRASRKTYYFSYRSRLSKICQGRQTSCDVTVKHV